MSKDTCPKGHKLPNRTKTGRCTPLYCATETKKESKEIVKKYVGELAPLDTDEDTGDKARKLIAMRKSQREARREVIEAPDLGGEEAEKWADEKIVTLLPKAVAELEYQLEYGSDEQRERAANKVLDANGRGKQDKAGAGSAPIILLNVQPGQVPWAKRVDRVPETLSDNNNAEALRGSWGKKDV